jgi:hypothetical protein
MSRYAGKSAEKIWFLVAIFLFVWYNIDNLLRGRNFMKKHLPTIGLNLVKVWGAAWMGFLIGSIPLYIIRGNLAPRNIENILFGIIGGVGAMITLFFFFKWEGRKREFRVVTPKEILLCSVAPTILWALIGSLFKPNPFLILTTVTSFCNGVMGVESVIEYTFIQPFPFALLFAVFYSAAIFGGYMYGRKHSDL